ncbi:vesicle transport protein GOT1B-like isoform X2 [Tigriopus californicus]|uniref:vesicle transport protein GOT1B-like isoform X2 n=1 Tax=Tigriopus californicus TaxID=6832 RepID=UPI0027D9F7F0|nr:vesicle transport protein GOT1B-like isoform X2 [Tigriopus californicus]
MIEITDFQKIGVGLAGFGVSFLFLGVLLLFDKGLIAIGNILFLSGLAFVIGLERTFRFFFQWHKARGSIAFFGGISVVLFGYPLIGMLIECYGFFVLFSGFFPVAINFLRRIPVIGTILNMPPISTAAAYLAAEDPEHRSPVMAPAENSGGVMYHPPKYQ